MQRGGAVDVEEEGWVGGWRGQGGEVHGFLGPVGGVGRGGVGGCEPVREAGVVCWIYWRVGRGGLVFGCGYGGYTW